MFIELNANRRALLFDFTEGVVLNVQYCKKGSKGLA